jgi:thiol-disulfide isomerase/thioredoxin
MVRLLSIIVFLSGLFALGFAQSVPASDSRPDPAALLNQISKKYAEARYYHIEAVEETDSKGELFKNWDKAILVASVAPDKRYHYEARTQNGSALKISDGKTETFYNIRANEYTQEPVGESDGRLSDSHPMYFWEAGLQSALTLFNSLSKGKGLRSPVYLQDEVLTINGKPIPCYVIQGKSRYGGGPPNSTSDITYWIDKDKLLVRKKRVHAEGTVRSFAGNTVEDRTALFSVMEIGDAAYPDTLFAFQPPAGARLVRQFLNPWEPQDQLAGTPAPYLKLLDASGKAVTLQDFHGKPVLLDFWATWCAPCVSALEPLKKLQQENASKGLVILGIDEDQDAGTGSVFLARRGVTWANFHDDGEIWRTFPSNSGIPYYVLVDASGQIVLAKPSAEESELRAAIARLGSPPAK